MYICMHSPFELRKGLCCVSNVNGGNLKIKNNPTATLSRVSRKSCSWVFYRHREEIDTYRILCL